MTADEMDALLTTVENRLARGWHTVIAWLRDHNQIGDIEARLAAGDIDGAIQGVADAAGKFAADIHAGYSLAGAKEATWLDGETDALVRFDQTNTRAVAWAEQNQASAVRGLVAEQRKVVSQVVSDGVRAGTNPRVVARDLRDSIGLTPSQAQAVASYRRALEAGDLSNALDRELRDGRYDSALQTAMRDGRGIPADRIDAMVERYRANYVAYRAETIARTEALRAAHQGAHEAVEQAVQRGDIDAGDVKRTWNHVSRGKHARQTHAAMQGQVRGFGEKFRSGSGEELAYPGDPDAPPSETIDCRCAVSTRLT